MGCLNAGLSDRYRDRLLPPHRRHLRLVDLEEEEGEGGEGHLFRHLGLVELEEEEGEEGEGHLFRHLLPLLLTRRQLYLLLKKKMSVGLSW